MAEEDRRRYVVDCKTLHSVYLDRLDPASSRSCADIELTDKVTGKSVRVTVKAAPRDLAALYEWVVDRLKVDS